jgi:predicted MPP superfamily phosphohydrolase
VRFAVFADITGGEREGVFEMAVEQLNLLRPELIVNVGDLIDGDTDRAELDRQWDSFDARADKAQARLFYTGGNHDLLNMEMRAAWEDRVGPANLKMSGILDKKGQLPMNGNKRCLEYADCPEE